MDPELIGKALIAVGVVGGVVGYIALMAATRADHRQLDQVEWRARSWRWDDLDAADASLPSSRRAVASLVVMLVCFGLVIVGAVLAN